MNKTFFLLPLLPVIKSFVLGKNLRKSRSKDSKLSSLRKAYSASGNIARPVDGPQFSFQSQQMPSWGTTENSMVVPTCLVGPGSINSYEGAVSECTAGFRFPVGIFPSARKAAANLEAKEKRCSSGNIKIFPNPGKGLFTVDMTAIKGRISLIINDLNGMEVTSKDIVDDHDKRSLFILTDIASGIYMLRITTGEQVFAESIIIR